MIYLESPKYLLGYHQMLFCACSRCLTQMKCFLVVVAKYKKYPHKLHEHGVLILSKQ